MFLTVLLAALLAAAPAGTREEAERLARTGAHAQALREFQRFTAGDPNDFDSWVWIGRLQSWLGREAEAAAAFRRVLAGNPDHVEAMTGLGALLSRTGQLDEALSLLERAVIAAPADADVLFALGRAHRLAGHQTAASGHFQRAYLVRPDDPDIRLAHEQAQRARSVSVDVGGVNEVTGGTAAQARSGHVGVSVPFGDRVRVAATAQMQERFGRRESRAGAAVDWMASHRLTIGARALVGASGTVLPRADVGADVAFARGRVQWLGSIRAMHFAAADALVASPGLAWSINDSLDVTGRIYFGVSEDSSGARTISRSGSLGAGVRATRRLWLQGGYALGFEALERPSAIDIRQTGLRTLSGGLRVDLTGRTSISGGYEWQHGGPSADVGRFAIAFGRTF